jgi:8-amino-3,8-dideoxy-alpha-D-manno-octulosonate transaminase
MEHLLNQNTVTPEGCPFNCPIYAGRGGAQKYHKGMLPQTDELLNRAINISIGVFDPGLGSGFGVKVFDGPAEVEASASRFRQVALNYLG